MLTLSAIILIVLGLLSASHLIVSNRPDAREMIEKLAAYQGWVGVAGAIWGAWSLLNAVLNVDLTNAFVGSITAIVVSAVTLLNGFLLGFGLGMTFVKDEAAKEKAGEAYTKLLPYQTGLGIAALALGVWGIVAAICFH